MSSFPTPCRWHIGSGRPRFKALSRMSSFPTSLVLLFLEGEKEGFQSAVAHELISNAVDVREVRHEARRFQSAVAHELISNKDLLPPLAVGRRFQSAVAHELISNRYCRHGDGRLPVCFKALSRMSSFPTRRNNDLQRELQGFKALSRMSSFPTATISQKSTVSLSKFQSAVAHELISNC